MNYDITSLDRSIQYNGIDLIKFIMSIFIIMLHSAFLLDISYDLNYLFQFGFTRVAVPFFFIASGFFLYRKIDIHNIEFFTIKKYIKHILLLYMVWTLIYSPMIVRELLQNEKGIFIAMALFIRNTLISGSYFHLWFLQALVVASLLVTFLLYLRVSIKKIFIVAGLMYCVSLLGQAYYGIFDYFFPEGSTMYDIWKFLARIFVTPRDGFCFGFIFFYIGAYIAFSNISISKNRLKLYLILSLLLLVLEIMCGSFYGFNRKSDVYISLLPVAYYLFLYAKNLDLKSSSLWSYLRKQSMYIYYIHAWFLYIVAMFLGTGEHSLFFLGHFAIFLLTLLLSMIFGHSIIELSKNPKYKFLKYLS